MWLMLMLYIDNDRHFLKLYIKASNMRSLLLYSLSSFDYHVVLLQFVGVQLVVLFEQLINFGDFHNFIRREGELREKPQELVRLQLRLRLVLLLLFSEDVP